MAKIYREVFGCSANVADYEIASGLLKKAGFEFTDCPKDSDLNIIFTCTVKVPTIQRMVFRIKELTKSSKPLIIAGCLPKANKKLVEKINSEACLLAPDQVEKIVDVARAALEIKKLAFLGDLKKPKLDLPRCRKNPIIGITQIGRGCLSNCSFCTEPYKGKLFSYPSDSIIKDVRKALEKGCKEIWLTSLDDGCYGFDLGTNLAELLNKISGLNEKFFVRVGMANPSHIKKILDELIQAYQNKKIFKFLHLPVQSGSNRILELMKRGYMIKDFLEIVKKFREKIPELTLATDIIIGFPSETEEDFRKTIELIDKIKPDVVNLSKFGAMPRTEAAKMRQLDVKNISERSIFLANLIKEITLEKNKKWVGWEGEILIDEKGKADTWIGRNFAYKPIVIQSPENLFGKFCEVKISDATTNFLTSKKL